MITPSSFITEQFCQLDQSPLAILESTEVTKSLKPDQLYNHTNEVYAPQPLLVMAIPFFPLQCSHQHFYRKEYHDQIAK